MCFTYLVYMSQRMFSFEVECYGLLMIVPIHGAQKKNYLYSQNKSWIRNIMIVLEITPVSEQH